MPSAVATHCPSAGQTVLAKFHPGQLTRLQPSHHHCQAASTVGLNCHYLQWCRDIVKLPERRAAEADEMLRTFCCAIPKVCFVAGSARMGMEVCSLVMCQIVDVPMQRKG